MSEFVVRTSDRGDLAAIDALLARSYPVLLKPDYPPSVLVTALPLISRANPSLVSSGTYYVAEDVSGKIVGAGGWTLAAPPGQRAAPQLAHVRHVVTDHKEVRRGVGRSLMTKIIEAASESGASRINCLSTRSAVLFYRNLGFVEVGPRDVQLRQGIMFPSVEMERSL